MLTGLVHLHNALRWIILILLVVTIIQALTQKKGVQKNSLYLLIAAHITLLLGLFQYFNSEVAGFKIIARVGGMANVMKDSFARFWVVEHISVMLIAIVLITLARGRVKKAKPERCRRFLHHCFGTDFGRCSLAVPRSHCPPMAPRHAFVIAMPHDAPV